MSKKKGKVVVKFIGNNATSVTGSATLISFEGRNILFECGGIQEGRTTYDNYKLNRELISNPQKTVDDAQNISHNIGKAIGQARTGVQQVERHQCDDSIHHAYDSIFEQMNARFPHFGFIQFHHIAFDNLSVNSCGA